MKRPFAPRLIALLLAAMMALSVPVSASSGWVPSEPAESSMEESGAVESAMQENPEDPEPEDPTEPEDPEPEDPEPEDPEPEEPAPRPISEWTDAEIIEAYDVPDSWARDALVFALRNGLIVGRGEDGLCPEGMATRAEMATILTRVLACEAQADLSDFRDVDPAAWYYGFLSRAAALGLFAGTGSETMSPNAPLTREEAFTVLAKAFGVAGRGCGNIYRFYDWAEVSAWAAPKLSAMIGAGLVAGYDGAVSPKANITRQELALLLYRLLSGFGAELPAEPGEGCFVLAADGIPAGTVFNGDLMLVNDAAEIYLDGVTVNGRLILQGASSVIVAMNGCQIRELVCCRRCVLVANGGVETVTALARTEIFDRVERAEAYGTLIVHESASVGTLNVNADELSVPLDGTAETVNVYGRSCKIGGAGYIGQLNVYGAGLDLWCLFGAANQQIAPCLCGITALRTDCGTASPASPRLTVGLRLTGLPAGPRGGTLTWYVGGRQISTETRMLSEGMTSSVALDLSAELAAGVPELNVCFVLSSEGERFVYEGSVDLSAWIRAEAATIRTQAVQAKVKYAATLYSSYNVYSKSFSGALGTVPAGTVVALLKTSKYTGARVYLPDGSIGWLSYNALSIYTGDYYTTSDYSRQAKEYFVNTVMGYSSQTGYLIWISLYTQRVNVFQGSKGNWKLIQCFPCSSGRNTCPTPVDSVTVRYRSAKWYFDGYYVHHVTVFDESRGFHSRPYYNNGSVKDYAMGRPASDGCVRMLDDDCTWIYDNIPVDTAVEIY